MFGRKILFLAAWYVAGNVVSSVYSNSKKKTQKTQSKQDIKMMLENFLQTQKNMFSDIEEKYVSDENKEKLAEKKKQFSQYSKKYLEQWEQLLQEIKNSKEISKETTKSGANSLLAWVRRILSSVDLYLKNTQDKVTETDREVQEVKKKISKK